MPSLPTQTGVVEMSVRIEQVGPQLLSQAQETCCPEPDLHGRNQTLRQRQEPGRCLGFAGLTASTWQPFSCAARP